MKEILDFVVNAVRKEEQYKQEQQQSTKPQSYLAFYADVTAGFLVEPCRKKALHCREREASYTKQLEEAEKELREKGVSVEVFDPATGTYGNSNNLASGLLTGAAQMFQPRVDQKLLDAVRNAKDKMLSYRGRAETYEKQATAYAFNPSFQVRLSVDDIHYFGLTIEK